MKKLSKKEKTGLFFSAFLVIAYIICSLFFDQYISYLKDITVQNILRMTIYILFGLALFYGTRIGDGKPVYRFSPIVLIILVLPSIYIVLAYFAVGLPFHAAIADSSIIAFISAVAVGYGIPYTFVSGFEIQQTEITEGKDTENKVTEDVSESKELNEEQSDEKDIQADEKNQEKQRNLKKD